MTGTPPQTPDFRRLAAHEVANLIGGVEIGSSLPVDSSSVLCGILEMLVPQVLRDDHPEWQKESIDGFLFSSAIRVEETSVRLSGLCILISDQTVTPFSLDMRLRDGESLQSLRIRLGEAGHGGLGMVGPVIGSGAARHMLESLESRLDAIDWIYDVQVPEEHQLLMLKRNETPDERAAYDLIATLDPCAIEALEARGVSLEPETEHDAAGTTTFAYVTCGGDEFLLIHHAYAPIPGVDVLTAEGDPGTLERLVESLGGGPSLVTWRSDAPA